MEIAGPPGALHRSARLVARDSLSRVTIKITQLHL